MTKQTGPDILTASKEVEGKFIFISMAFLENITIGQYVPAESVIHRLDPRTKLALILAVMILMVATIDLRVYLLISLFLLSLCLMSKVPLPYFFRNLRSFFWLFVLTFVLHIFFAPTETSRFWDLKLIKVSQQGVLNGAVYSWRIAIFIFSAAFLSLTTQAVEMTDAVFKSFSPLKRFKFPVEELSLITMISLRFVPLLLEEAITLKKAQMSRGASFEGGLIKKVRKTLPLLIPLFISSFRKADELALALDARGFRSGQSRSSFQRLTFKPIDFLFLCLIFVLAGVSYLIKVV
ncbi:MAG: energy-coupling factor transporter transmembrane component T [Candidatus Zixiibacteriota bacterium]